MTLLLTVALPLVGALLVVALPRRTSWRSVGAVAAAASSLSFGAAVAMAQAFAAGKPTLIADIAPWLPPSGADLTLRVEPPAVPLLLAVTGIAALVGIVAAADARHEDPRRFFAAYLLTVAGTVLLVVAADLALLLAGWGIAGAGAYVLIGHERERPAAANAAATAFVIDRIGDAALLLAIAAVYASFRTLDPGELAIRVAALGDRPDALAQLDALRIVPSALVLVAALTRSAQLPFHLWLPRASETLPSAAALTQSLVAASGVILLLRLLPFLHPAALVLAAALGGTTALFAGAVAAAQVDARRALLWSTVSQTGLMFVAAGVGSVFAATFQLIAHALAKATATLAADHAHRSRVARIAFALGLAGLAVTPASGAWSIAAVAAAVRDRPAYLIVVLASAAVAGFVAGRLWGAVRVAPADPTRTPLLVRAVLALLGAASLTFGALVAIGALSLGSTPDPMHSALPGAIAAALAVGGAAAGRWWSSLDGERALVARPVVALLASGLGLDRLYARTVVEGAQGAARLLEAGSEYVIETLGDGIGHGATWIGLMLRERHGARAQVYEAALIAGAAALVAYWGLR